MSNTVKNTTNDGLIFHATQLNLANLPRIDSHLHTSWTDGEASVKDVYASAIEKNLTAILYSEHSRKTSAAWFPAFADEIRQLPSSPCKPHVGTEVKVASQDGEIDTIPEIRNLCDYLMASVHRFVDSNGNTLQFDEIAPQEAVDLEFKLSWSALENPQVDILGHMFGMSYQRFNVIPPDEKICQLISHAAEFGVAIEVNSYYHPNPLQIIKWCQEFDALITFGSNAHKLKYIGSNMKSLKREASNA